MSNNSNGIKLLEDLSLLLGLVLVELLSCCFFLAAEESVVFPADICRIVGHVVVCLVILDVSDTGHFVHYAVFRV